MPYTPHTDQTREAMLRTIGVRRFEELLAPIPVDVRQKASLDLPDGLAESEVDQLLESLAAPNAVPEGVTSFLGGGIYDHHIPAAVDHVASRSEFYTAYTPYQPEVAQGTLQATYEYQSMIRRLTAMDVAQASLYDGGSAVAEAALLALAHTGRKTIILAGTLNPRYRSILETYLSAQSVAIQSAVGPDGRADFVRLGQMGDADTACIVMPSPNYFGMLEDWERGARIARNCGALMVAVFHPIALGLIRPPGECGADVAVGEGQCLGSPPSFGGPLLGLFAVRREFIRRLPGRLVGRSVDARGKTAYVMTLQTREQHIRREKATSNICTAQALLATRAAIHMALLGRRGIAALAQTCMQRAHYLAEEVARLPGYDVPFGPEFFNEFVVEAPLNARVVLERLREHRILGGIDLGGRFPGFERRFLVCVTEKHGRQTLDRFVQALREVAGHNVGESPSTTMTAAPQGVSPRARG
ncbi:MAG: aminomethyl-transferring glycine dehydrogenase subunit GcvPA [candidate division Zixibacteria bacterium]|nr:aminomethyl-transferring glycine dehydrogenase subunit GcvPA [candidate division Zixibacteria bacterium]